jgi:hypothetical protein
MARAKFMVRYPIVTGTAETQTANLPCALRLLRCNNGYSPAELQLNAQK